LNLEDAAAARFLGLLGFVQRGADGFVKNGFETLLSERRALEVLHGSNRSRHLAGIIVGNGSQAFRCKLGFGLWVVTQIALGANQDDGHARGMVLNLGPPFRLDVVERSGADDGEANQEDIRLRVREGTQSVIILLAGGIPQTQVDGLAIHHHVRGVVIKHSGNVLARERVGSVRDEKTCLTDGTISDHDTLDVLHDSAVQLSSKTAQASRTRGAIWENEFTKE